MQTLQRMARVFAALFLLTVSIAASADRHAIDPTPPRLSLIEGQVSFWRPGATDWTAAALNTPLAPGDALYTGQRANLELQVGSRAFVRAGERTQLSLVNRERGYVQFRVADGQASFDLRALPAGLVVEVDTPNAAFTIDRGGYYRLNVDKDTTLFITRGGGRATVIPSGGRALGVAPSEEVVVEGTDAPSVETYAAPEPDAWDRWNYARTDQLLDSLSARYLPSDVYGADALDHYGNWRRVSGYGTVWVPSGLPQGWAPYSTGRWIWDPFYGWTWIDDAPWGWAPFHYGRWVFLGGYWGWAPGPMATQSVYAPALVAFFDSGGGVSIGIGVGTPALSWVALSWGEPVIPWWGRRGFIGVPSWGGWGGPRIVNEREISRGTAPEVARITFQNTRVANAVVAVRHDQFGRGPARTAPVPAKALDKLAPVAGALPVKPTAASLTPGAASSLRPTAEVLSRPAVTLRAPRESRLPWRGEAPKGAKTSRTDKPPELRFVPPPKQAQSPPAPFGRQPGPERSAPSQPLRFEDVRRPAASDAPAPEARERQAPEARERPAPRRAEPAPPAAAAGQSPSWTEETRERIAPRRAEPQHSVRPEAAPSRETRELVAPRSVEPPHLSARPEAVQRERERGRDEARPLPGDPANRMSPKHRGREDAQKERGGPDRR